MLSHEQDAAGQTGLFHALTQPGFKTLVLGRRATRNDGRPLRMARQKLDHGIDKKVRALLMANAAEATDMEPVRIQAKLARCFGAIRRRAETLGGDPVHDDCIRHIQIGGRLAAGRDHRIHAADEKLRPARVMALRS